MSQIVVFVFWASAAVWGMDSFFDSKVDYRLFEGRATDRDIKGKIFKVHSANKNVKFFRAGDSVSFVVASRKSRECVGRIRAVEGNYFVMFVADLSPCLHTAEKMRRGMLLSFRSDDLARRVYDAGLYREVLVKRKAKLFDQLNKINYFVWSYDQQRVKRAAEFEKRVIAINKAKQEALDKLGDKKRDSLLLQVELNKRLDQVAEDLEFYRIEKRPPLPNRWGEDRDLGLPLVRKPPRLKEIPKSSGIDLDSF